LKAINHCHSLKIAHRDIKPENILLGENGSVKLIDFGLSKQVKSKKMNTIVGTPYYIAPEVLKGNYNVKCDIWSLGVIMYILLSGYLPFGGTGAAEVFEKVQAGEYSFSQKEWKKVSDEAMDLISKMLQVDTKKRYTAEQCLKHEWFVKAGEFKNDDDKDPLDPDMIKNLLAFKGSSRLK
jgi:calcium-dependent protein kinase